MVFQIGIGIAIAIAISISDEDRDRDRDLDFGDRGHSLQLGHFSVMQYFGFIVSTRSVNIFIELFFHKHPFRSRSVQFHVRI